MDLSVLVLFLFLLHCQAEGDVKEETLYVKTGTDLLLDVGEPVTIDMHEFMFWKFQSKVTIVRLTPTNEIIPNEDFPGRAELFPQNQSLLLKNVQKTDSGLYTAGVYGFKNRDLVKYQVTVLDPVSDVKLEVKQCSSDRSDLTVTCTTLDALLNSTFICENTTCSHEGGEPVQDIPPGASLKVYLKDGSVTCHHSNQVSSKEDTKTIEDLCRKGPGNSALIAIIVVILVVTCVVAAAVVYYRRRRKQGGKMDVVDAETGEWGNSEREPLKGPGPIHDAKGDAPNTIYSMTGTPSAAPSGPPGETEEEEKTGPAEPEVPLTSPVQFSQRKPAAGAETAEPRRTEELQARRGRSGRKRQKRQTKASRKVTRPELKPGNDAEGDAPNTNSSMTETPSAAPSSPPVKTEGSEDPGYGKPEVPLPSPVQSSQRKTAAGAETAEPRTTEELQARRGRSGRKRQKRETKAPQTDTLQGQGPSNDAEGDAPNTNSSMTGTPTAAPSGPPGETEGGENREDPPLPEASQRDTRPEQGPSNDAEDEPPNTNSSMTGTPTAAPSGPPGETEEEEKTGPAEPEVPLTSPVQFSQRKPAAGAETAEPRRTEELQARRGRSGRERQKRQTKASRRVICLEQGPSNDAEGDAPNTNSSMTETPSAAPSGPPGKTEGGEDLAYEQPEVKRRKNRFQDTENLRIHKKIYIRGQDQLMVPKDFPGEVQPRPGPNNDAEGEPPITVYSMTETPTAAPSGPPDDMEVDKKDNGGTEDYRGSPYLWDQEMVAMLNPQT